MRTITYICCERNGRVRNTRIRHRSWIDTAPSLALILFPEIADRRALKQNKEEICRREEAHHGQRSVHNISMHRVDNQPQQQNRNREPDEDGGNGIEDLAEPPVVQRFWDV